ncbi:ATP-binding cassette domain-containing protein [Enteractinococcus coprophilus]|uniref:ABC-2 type transport system ATP-binding protein n=1 Tax=Enteractinococcus coprophilus TaxID=1027633 RepID=A0A543A0J2_9MICC|nr:ATP-binding cassette domain-containing protein [Enteractinococcus coprophilus]TQL66020.1 ABC-2 type transport system ATP-binding protein [Enteractinococcus coprophilus]
MTSSQRDGHPLAVETQNLTQHFGTQTAVDDVNLSITAGGVHAVLGPNGAGKTTVMRILATLLRPSSGYAKVLGYDVLTHPGKVRERIALTGQFASLDEDLTGLENLAMLARLRGYRGRTAKSRAESLLEAFGLLDAAARQVRKYSGGMRRRLDIAASLLVRPDLLFLDEPTTGLDPRSRNDVWDAVRTLVSAGTTVLLTTQYLDEADQLADRVTVLDAGRIVAEGTPGELKSIVGSGILHIRFASADQAGAAVTLLDARFAEPTELSTDGVTVSMRLNDITKAAELIAELQRQGVHLTEFSLGQPSLNEVFLALTTPRSKTQEKPDDR